MRIAIIGGGVSGLACAYLLHREHEVVLFEREGRAGGHTHTVNVDIAGQPCAVDTGFIVFNNRTYPNFIRLLDQLKVNPQPTQMSFSVSCPLSGIEYGSVGFNGLFAQRRNLVRPAHYRMLRDILRFNRESRALLGAPCGLSLGEYLAQGRYSDDFIDRYLLPMCAAIWSGSLDAAAQFPVDHFVEFFDNHGLLTVTRQPQWYVIQGGSHSYVKAMLDTLGSRVRTGQPVVSVIRHEKGVRVRTANEVEHFDQVIFACHSDQALALLENPSDAERDILGALPFQPNEVVLHTDRSLLPTNQRAWASWNYRVSGDRQKPATVTYHMNRLQSLDVAEEVCVTLNQSKEIEPSRILGRYIYDHPVYTLKAQQARERRGEINGQNRSYYCGAYWGNGFHEDGVRSALDVTRQFGVSL